MQLHSCHHCQLHHHHPGKREQNQYLSKRICGLRCLKSMHPIQSCKHRHTATLTAQLIEGKWCAREAARPPEHLFIIYLFSIAMHTESMWKCFNSKLLQSIIHLISISDPIDLANIYNCKCSAVSFCVRTCAETQMWLRKRKKAVQPERAHFKPSKLHLWWRKCLGRGKSAALQYFGCMCSSFNWFACYSLNVFFDMLIQMQLYLWCKWLWKFRHSRCDNYATNPFFPSILLENTVFPVSAAPLLHPMWFKDTSWFAEYWFSNTAITVLYI